MASLRCSIFLLLAILGTALARYQQSVVTYKEPIWIHNREVSQTLYIDNPYHDAGSWGKVELCQNGSYVNAIEIMYNPPNNLDETAINGIKLYCIKPDGLPTGYVTSTVGKYGKWYGMYPCSTSYLTGFRANVLEYQGIFTDDVAIEDFEIDCNHGAEIIDPLPIPVPMNTGQPEQLSSFRAGVWSSYATCQDDLAVCGLQTRYDASVLGDETSICDVVFFCCAY